jgi:hypothetical protein
MHNVMIIVGACVFLRGFGYFTQESKSIHITVS